MKIRCKHCGEFFCPSDESVDLISEGYVSSDNANICDDCWEMINQPPDDLIEMISDADPGL
jgi:Pyruvate/2-oxoacid:ferredoxin oxidoreductase delta subunit